LIIAICIVADSVANFWQMILAKSTEKIRPLAKKFAHSQYPLTEAVLQRRLPQKSYKKLNSQLKEIISAKNEGFYVNNTLKKSSAIFFKICNKFGHGFFRPLMFLCDHIYVLRPKFRLVGNSGY
jgi:hypothetical protein